MKLTMHLRSTVLCSLVILLVLVTGCAPLKKAPAPTATLAPTATSAPTATFTPVPTSTATATNTAVPTSTATPNQTATAEAKATSAAADMIAKIEPDLKKLGFSTDKGKLGFVSEEPMDLVASSYGEENIHEVSPDNFTDFILKTDIEWNSTNGFSGCAISFRAAADYDQGGLYWFPLMRLQAAPGYDIEFHQYKQWKATLTNNRTQFSRAIKDGNGDVNTVILVVQGDKFTPYVNGEKLVSGINGKLTEGLVAFSAWQNSGKTECIFSNTWMWLLK